MSLQEILNEKTIKGRKERLSAYLRDNTIGVLHPPESIFYNRIFQTYYTDPLKFETVEEVKIIRDKHGNKCFMTNGYPTSITKLAGSKVNEKLNLIRSLRNAIEYQIQEFRECTPKTNFVDTMVVDHKIPFHILSNAWLQNKHVTYTYSIAETNYVLDEPFLSEWRAYHKKHAILRWLTEEENKTAHKHLDKTPQL